LRFRSRFWPARARLALLIGPMALLTLRFGRLVATVPLFVSPPSFMSLVPVAGIAPLARLVALLGLGGLTGLALRPFGRRLARALCRHRWRLLWSDRDWLRRRQAQIAR
jgi:hypothetical protein